MVPDIDSWVRPVRWDERNADESQHRDAVAVLRAIIVDLDGYRPSLQQQVRIRRLIEPVLEQSP